MSNDCPIMNKVDKDRLLEYVEKEFLNIAKYIIKNNPDMITEYNRDLKFYIKYRMKGMNFMAHLESYDSFQTKKAREQKKKGKRKIKFKRKNVNKGGKFVIKKAKIMEL